MQASDSHHNLPRNPHPDLNPNPNPNRNRNPAGAATHICPRCAKDFKRKDNLDYHFFKEYQFTVKHSVGNVGWVVLLLLMMMLDTCGKERMAAAGPNICANLCWA